MFRRRSTDSPAVVDDSLPPAADHEANGEADEAEAARRGVTASKGRPTPKRSEAESRRRQPYTAPAGRKAAGRQSRERDKTTRQQRMAALKRGEEWALPPKDKGPVRALARDYVDSRRTLSEYYLYGVVVLVVALFVPALHKSLIVDYLILIILAVLVTEAVLIGRRVVKLAQERYPGQSTRGLKLYAAMRGTQMRRLRVPAPRVNRGDRI